MAEIQRYLQGIASGDGNEKVKSKRVNEDRNNPVSKDTGVDAVTTTTPVEFHIAGGGEAAKGTELLSPRSIKTRKEQERIQESKATGGEQQQEELTDYSRKKEKNSFTKFWESSRYIKIIKYKKIFTRDKFRK